MKSLSLTLLGFSIVSFSWGQTGLDLTGWQVTGAELSGMTREKSLYLPGGAQMFYTIQGGGVTLRLNSNPEFAEDPAEMALLEFGSTALAFVREKQTAGLKLVRGDQEPELLPVSWPLDEHGRPTESLSLELTQRGTTLTITTQGRMLHRETTPLAASTEIVLSSGTSQGWLIQSLSLSKEPVVDSSSKGTGGTDADLATFGNTESILRYGHEGDDVTPLSVQQAGQDEASSKISLEKEDGDIQRAVPLEIFTPPAVRRSRSAEVRAVLSNANLN